MFKVITNRTSIISKCSRFFSLFNCLLDNYCCKVLVVGGGTGGCAVASKLSRKLKKTELIILEPCEHHFYQAWFTLCGAGLKRVEDTVKLTANVLPRNAIWIQDTAAEFFPEDSKVITDEGDKIEYDVLVLAAGLVITWNKIPGLLEGLKNYDNVGTIYSPRYAEKTYHALDQFKCGNIIFTSPRSLIKCPGAPLKICYLIEDILRLKGIRDQAEVFYHTPFSKLFMVKSYERTLRNIANKRNINIDLFSHLEEIRPDKSEVVFRNVKTQEPYIQNYAILHVTPPMCPPEVVTSCGALVNKHGYVEVDKYTMQHVRFPNIFAIGDCSSTPNSKTAAACAAQAPVVYENVQSTLAGSDCIACYDGYTSCPLVTAIGKCILAEFNYSYEPTETFPFSQNRELWITYFVKKEILPRLYWHLMMKGYWNGPHAMRDLFHFGLQE